MLSATSLSMINRLHSFYLPLNEWIIDDDIHFDLIEIVKNELWWTWDGESESVWINLVTNKTDEVTKVLTRV